MHLEQAAPGPWQEVPFWMFDRMACGKGHVEPEEKCAFIICFQESGHCPT